MKLRAIKLAKFQGKVGYGYCGRCAGGENPDLGGQFLVIASSDAVLNRIWDALGQPPLDHKLVYDAGAIKTARVEALAATDDCVPLQDSQT